MWSPTHVQVTVQRARGLLAKGKNGTNDCFVTIGLGKDKFQTSVKEKADVSLEWHEECELPIPAQGNTAAIVLTVLHRGFLGVDEFLGRANIPLADLDVYERPRSRWYQLESKPGSSEEKKDKKRGELEVRIQFTVKAGSLTDLSKGGKHKGSLGKLAQSVGGSLLSIGTLENRKGLKKFAKSLGSRVHLNRKDKKRNGSADQDSIGSGSNVGLERSASGALIHAESGQRAGEADPGVISEDEDEFAFDDLSHKSSGSSLNANTTSSPYQPSSAANSASPSTPLNSNPPLKRPKSFTLKSEEESVAGSPHGGGSVDVSPVPRARSHKTLPRVSSTPAANKNDNQLDEWEQKLYGRSDGLLPGSTDSLKRRSWMPPVKSESNEELDKASPLPTSNTSLNSSSNLSKSYDKLDSLDTPPRTPEALIESESKSPSMKSKTVSAKDDSKESSGGLFGKKLRYFKKDKHSEDNNAINERIIIGGENENVKLKKGSSIPREILQKFEGKSREDIILTAHNLQSEVVSYKQKCRELEDYLDSLLLRVMETTPRILQNPYTSNAISSRSSKHSSSG